ncbi:SURF1 family cytochrome oxidase biogenesis protein [Rathayibacter soli]|uniref:SURF1 family cytochrome oxidase biogenesis protein n=1 Tax=Rathayibacter soli TaxID=3144168 RepID=UPI0027E4B5D8|nr:SURF1 family protein [Glaciibacter superstes]
MTENRPRTTLAQRGSRDVARLPGGGALAKPAAVYDTVTEGLTGRQFLRTGRWIAYIALAVAFALICCGLALWQFDRGRQASTDNAIVNTNFNATPVPLSQALPTGARYHSGQNWQRVSATGRYDANEQLIVRNRFLDGNIGFEVLTPLRTDDGATIMVDRGWTAPSTADLTVPASNPAPPGGEVSVVLRLRPSEAAKGSGSGASGQIQSIDLAQIQQRVGGAVQTSAYGVLDTQTPAASKELTPIQPTAPTEGVGYHYSYVGQWLLFVFIAFFILARAIRNETRRLNADDPAEQARAAERVRKQAAKPFTDEESEDELIDGYIPLSRWGFASGGALTSAAGSSAREVTAAPRALPPVATQAPEKDHAPEEDDELPS